METKRCPRCDEPRPISEFGRNKGAYDGLTPYCRIHMNEWHREWRSKNKQAEKAIKKRAALKALYGLTLDGVQELLASQDGNCAVCGEPIQLDLDHRSAWHVDHCHDTGTIRGILHGPCNSMLGLAGDNPERLRQGAAYLEGARQSAL